MASQATLHLTEAAFDQTLAEHQEPMIVDFWAEWCGPCKAIAPTLDELAQEYSGRVTIAKVNVDEHPGLAARFQVRSIPTLLFFKGGAGHRSGHRRRSQGADQEALGRGRLRVGRR